MSLALFSAPIDFQAFEYALFCTACCAPVVWMLLNGDDKPRSYGKRR